MSSWQYQITNNPQPGSDINLQSFLMRLLSSVGEGSISVLKSFILSTFFWPSFSLMCGMFFYQNLRQLVPSHYLDISFNVDSLERAHKMPGLNYSLCSVILHHLDQESKQSLCLKLFYCCDYLCNVGPFLHQDELHSSKNLLSLSIAKSPGPGSVLYNRSCQRTQSIIQSKIIMSIRSMHYVPFCSYFS
jgi:hypothetical protein